MENLDTLTVDRIAELARASGAELVTIKLPEMIPGLPESVPALINRETGHVSPVLEIFEKHRMHPTRKRGTANVTTLNSFIELTSRHKKFNSVIFAETDWRKPALTAVIDYHASEGDITDGFGNPEYGQHRVHYAFPLSEEWRAWIDQDGKMMNQADFAEWIENHITELAAPDPREAEGFEQQFGFKTAHPNEMQTLSRGLALKAEVRVKSNVVLQTGEGEISFEEEHRDSMGNKFTVPGLFILSISPFFRGERCRIPVRLRYRIKDGSAVWFFKIFRPDLHITEHVMRYLDTAAKALELPAYQGEPEMNANGVYRT